MSHAQQRWILALLCLFAAIPVGWISWQLRNRQTAPHRLLWLDHHNQPMFAKPYTATTEITSCRGDTSWQTLTVGHNVWSLCAQGIFTPQQPTRYVSGVYVRFDLSRHLAQALWPLPKTLAHFQTVGILPFHTHTLGIVYRANHAMGPLVVGITGPNGWSLAPTALPSSHSGRLLGMHWQGNTLEFIVTSSHVMDRLGLRTAPFLYKATAQHSLSSEEIPRQALCQNHRSCHLVAAYRPTPSDLWHILVARKRAWDVAFRPSKTHAFRPPTATSAITATTLTSRLHNIPKHPHTTNPTIRQTTWQMRFKLRPDLQRYLPWLDRRIDFSSPGLLPSSAHSLESRWDRTGKITPLASMAGWSRHISRITGHFVFEQAQLFHRMIWADGPKATLFRIAGQTIRIASQQPKRPLSSPAPSRRRRTKARGYIHPHDSLSTQRPPPSPVSLLAQRIETWHTAHLGTITRDLAGSCVSLFRGTWVERPQQQGHWLISPTGCLVTVDHTWKRIDRLTIPEHLQQQARALQTKLPALWTLLWLLGGGPLCLFMGWIANHHATTLSTPDSSDPEKSPSPLWIPIIAVFFYLLSSLYFGWTWWAILSQG